MRLSIFLILFCVSIESIAQSIRWIAPSHLNIDTILAHSNHVFVSSPAAGTVQKWDLTQRRYVKTVAPHYRGAPIAISPDGALLLTFGDAAYHLWNLPTATGQRLSPGPAETDAFVGFQSSSNRIIFLSPEKGFIFFDITSRSMLQGSVAAAGISPANYVRVIPSRDGERAALVLDNSKVRTYSLSTLDYETLPNPGSVYYGAFSPDGALLAFHSHNPVSGYMVRVYDFRAADYVAGLNEDVEFVDRLAFAPARSILATVSKGIVVLWDLNTRRAIKRISRIGRSASSYSEPMAFSADGSVFMVGPDVVDQNTGEPTRMIPRIPWAHNLAFNADGSLLAINGDVPQVWDAKKGERLFELRADTPQNNNVAALGYSSVMRGYNAPIHFTADGKTVIVGANIYSLQDGKLISTLPVGNTYPTIVEMAPDWFYTASRDSAALRIRRYSDGSVIHQLTGTNLSGSTAIGTSHSGAIVAAGGAYIRPNDDHLNRTINLWSTATGQLIDSFQNDQYWPHKIIFSRDDQYLASGADRSGAEVNVWHVPTGRQVAAFRDRQTPAVGFDFLPDSRTIVYGVVHKLEFWDLHSNSPLTTITNEVCFTTALAVAPDGRSLAVSRTDGTLVVYNVPPMDRLALTTTDQGPVLSFLARASVNYSVEKSSDLRNWTPLTNIVGADKAVDLPIQLNSTTFYRLR